MSTMLKRPVRVSRLAQALGLAFEGEDFELGSVAPVSALREGALTFMTRAMVVALPSQVAVLSKARVDGLAWLRAESPRLAFVKALQWFDRDVGFDRAEGDAQIHPSVRIGSGVSIGRGVVVDEGTVLEHNIRIADGVRIGKDCRIKSGTVIGEDGFGFERDADGTPLRMIDLGGVIIGDRVELGSLNTVCQGTLSPTVVEDDVKTDDHVHIAHNCWVKKKALLTACVELSGGVTIGEGAWLGPNVSVIDGGKIGDNAFVGIGAVVIRPVLPGTTVVGNPARELPKKS